MPEPPANLRRSIKGAVRQIINDASTVTAYREPLVGFADARDPRFLELRRVADPSHMMPGDLLPGSRSIISFFIPFDSSVVEANAQEGIEVADEWALAYVETNELIARAIAHLIELLDEWGAHGTAGPPTDNFDHAKLISRWSHKSVAVIAGLGSFGLHHMVITDAGCAGRFGSVVTDLDLPCTLTAHKERCLYFHNGSCRVCVARCPIDALSEDGGLDRQRCWSRCLEVGKTFHHLGPSEVCGKCAVGPCSSEPPVHQTQPIS